MNAITETASLDQSKVGLYQKFTVTRTDGKDAPGGKHEKAEYFVLNLITDTHALPAIAAYADSCQEQYPLLAADLRAKVATAVTAASEFVEVPETTLPNGHVEPAFIVARYLASKGPASIPLSTPTGQPWTRINYREAIAAAATAGLKLITETQALAIAWNISQQDINWTGGKVGAGKVFQGLHKDALDGPQPSTYESTDSEERRWHDLSNGERVYDFAGNAYTWAFDNVQGDEEGIVAKAFGEDSPSITTPPHPSMENGVGWYPDAGDDWSGYALIRGGFWRSGGSAGVFSLNGGWPDLDRSSVGFRCTK